MKLKTVIGTAIIIFFTLTAILIWRFSFCIIFCGSYFTTDSFIGVDILISLIGLLGIFLLWRFYYSYVRDNNEFKKFSLKPFLVIPIMMCISIFASVLENEYGDTYRNIEKSVIISNIVDRPVGPIDALPIGIEFEYSIQIKRSKYLSPLLYKIFTTEYTDHGTRHYLDPFSFNPRSIIAYRRTPDYSTISEFYQSAPIVSISPEAFLNNSTQQEYSLNLNSRNLESGKKYRVVARTLPDFFRLSDNNSSSGTSKVQQEFFKKIAFTDNVGHDTTVGGPTCIIKVPLYQESIGTEGETFSQVQFIISEGHDFKTNNVYSHYQFYKNAIASGIPFCD